jgi:hypothetical protein
MALKVPSTSSQKSAGSGSENAVFQIWMAARDVSHLSGSSAELSGKQ